MRSVDSWLDRFAWKHSRFGIPNLMMIIIIGTVAVFLLDQFSGGTLSSLLSFYPAAILQGQVWRLVTFVFVPNTYEIFWFALSMFFYAFLGPTMEREWGSAKFTLFYACGILLSVLFGFAAYFISGFADLPTASAYYLNLSLFLAFATLYPDAPLRFYFVIPIRAKWLAVFYVFMMVWDIVKTPTLFLPMFLPMLLPPMLASLINYLLFFWTDISAIMGRTARRAQHQRSKQTVNFKQATKQARDAKGYLHKCTVCGKTDADDAGAEFRYCSKCNGYHCYCMDHINNHVHID